MEEAVGTPETPAGLESEVLVVTSKVKKFIKDRADMNTAGNVAEILSVKVRDLLLQAIEKAKADGRKTVKDRDF